MFELNQLYLVCEKHNRYKTELYKSSAETDFALK